MRRQDGTRSRSEARSSAALRPCSEWSRGSTWHLPTSGFWRARRAADVAAGARAMSLDSWIAAWLSLALPPVEQVALAISSDPRNIGPALLIAMEAAVGAAFGVARAPSTIRTPIDGGEGKQGQGGNEKNDRSHDR